MSTELATVGPSSGALALRSDQYQWNDQQRAALAQIGIEKAGQGDQQVFMHVCQRTGLDPFSKQIYMIERGGKWTIQTAIDGFRVIASRHPEYAGQTAPQWCGDDGVWKEIWVGSKPPTAARVGILRSDWTQPAWGVALFSEFTAGNSMWKSKGAHMLAKCAEALGFRKAFPHDLAGLMTPEEAERDDRPRGRGVPHQSGAAPVTITELTGGTPVPPDPEPEPPTGGGGRMSQEQQKKIFALLREVEIEDRMAYASNLLGRDVTSYGQLTLADASKLIENLQAITNDDQPAAGGES